MYPHSLKIYTRFHISLHPQYPTSCRCGVFRCSPKLHTSQISLDPQNPTSWLCRVSHPRGVMYPHNLKLYTRFHKSSNPQYPSSWGCYVFRKSYNHSQISNILISSKSMILAVWGFQISFSECILDSYILIS